MGYSIFGVKGSIFIMPLDHKIKKLSDLNNEKTVPF